MPSPSLDRTQRLLWQLIVAPEGAAAGLVELPAAERTLAESLVREDERLPAVERIEIYANQYFYRIRDSLKDDFTALHAVAGEENFHNLITDYLLEHPPTHYSLRYAGQHLPGFVGTHPLAARWPYLADLATLEWSVLEAFDAPDAPPLDGAALSGVAQESWPALRFQLTPSLRVLHVDWPVQEVWRQVRDGEPPTEPRRAPMVLRVWRQNLRVFHRIMDAAETAGLTAIAAGAPFAEVCERIVAAAGAAGDAPADRAFGLLSEWFADGLLSGYSFA
jgi:hypothetical protein